TLASNQGLPRTAFLDDARLYWVGDSGNVSVCAVPGCPGGPIVVAPQQEFPYFVAAHAGNVFWTNGAENGSVMTCSRAACTPQRLATATQPRGIAVDDSGVYWVTTLGDGDVLTCPLSGCGAGPITLASHQGSPFAVVVDSTSVYW